MTIGEMEQLMPGLSYKKINSKLKLRLADYYRTFRDSVLETRYFDGRNDLFSLDIKIDKNFRLKPISHVPAD